MVKARRAALEEEILEATTVEATPRRGAVPADEPAAGGGKGRLITRFIAPLALTGIVAAGAITLNREGNSSAVADPVQHSADLGVSRNLPREEISAPAESPSSSPSAVDPLPTMEAAPAEPSSAEPSPAETEAPAPEPTATPSETTPAKASAPEPAKSTTAKPSTPELGKESGTMYTVKSVNVRTGPGTDFDVRVTLKGGAEVTVTDVTQDGWQQIVHKKSAGWVKADLLAAEKPEETTPAPSSGGSCESSSAKGIESGLTSRTVSVLRAVCAAFPEVKSYGGYRRDSGYHGQGRAIDVMVSGERGWVIAKWLRENAKSLGVIEVIYQQKIWTTQRSSEGWRGMSDRGSATANHYDHVHISVG
ncbi:MAG: SH3 domain-containing protein [Propionibacteriaceae bacterium]|nr:SH3 domain-containing protein [Propionibacteriaceae bacterium]